MMTVDNIKRKIIHIDMDAFYASVEQRDNPSLRGKPIAVGGGEKRGVTTTASYEARKFGVRSAMPGYRAKALCPDLIFVKPRFDAYKEVSGQIRSVFMQYTDLIEPLSLDEAFLDVTNNKKSELIATHLARQIKQDIFAETNLTCSAGVSYCKFLAKVASDMNKPDGLTVIKPYQAEEFIGQLAIEKFYGVGKVTAGKMRQLGITNGRELRKWSKKYLMQQFGKAGGFYYDIARGIDNRPVENDRKRKSVGIERTLEEDLGTWEELQPILAVLVDRFFERLERNLAFGRTITLKLKTSDFVTITRSRSSDQIIIEKKQIKDMSFELLKQNIEAFAKIRLIGLTMSNLDQEDDNEPDSGQMRLFE